MRRESLQAAVGKPGQGGSSGFPSGRKRDRCSQSVEFILRHAARRAAVPPSPERRCWDDSLCRCGHRTVDQQSNARSFGVHSPRGTIGATYDNAIRCQRAGTPCNVRAEVAELRCERVLVNWDVKLRRDLHGTDLERVSCHPAVIEQYRMDGRPLLRYCSCKPEYLHNVPYYRSVTFTDTHAGRILGDQYVIKRRLGEGDYGVVYEVFDTRLQTAAAVKLLEVSAELLTNGVWREAEYLQQLDGEFILKVRSAIVLEGVPAIVTDLAENGSVADHIVHGIGLPISTTVRWLHQTARGLARVHDKGLLHCDVKPSNVFVDDDGNALLGDFGLARLPNAAGFAPAAGSTVTMPPEVAAVFAGMDDNTAVYNQRSDVYALGATAWWMLAGVPLHAGADEHAVLQAAQPDLWTVAPHVPRRLRDAVNRSLRINPDERFASASSFDAAIGVRNSAKREWTRISVEPGHLACFVGDKAGRAISVCASRRGRGITVAARHTESQRAIRSATRDVPERQMAAALRAVMSACS